MATGLQDTLISESLKHIDTLKLNINSDLYIYEMPRRVG